MATPPGPDTIELFKLLSDGQWHPYLEIRDALASKVPPGRAARKYDERIESARKLKGDPEYDTDASEDERIWLGAKACAQVCITSWKERGRGIEQRGRKDNREIRIQPGFRLPGVVEPLPPGSEPENDVEASGVPEVPPADSEPSEVLPSGSEEEESPKVPVEKPPGPIVISAGQPRASKPSRAVPPVLVSSAGTPLTRLYPGDSATVTQSDILPGAMVVEVCDVCGLAVADSKIHDGWHDDLKGPEGEISDPEKGVTLSSELLDERFDRFQEGMQAWMAMQFEQLDLALRLWMRTQGRWGRDSESSTRRA